MRKNNFIWDKFGKKEFNNLLDFVNNAKTIDNDFIGCVEKGSLKFDFIYREIDTNQFKLCVDFYGLANDNSYNTSKDGKDYDYYDGFDIDIDTIKSIKSYRHFKRYCNKAIKENVIGNDYLNSQFNKPYENWK